MELENDLVFKNPAGLIGLIFGELFLCYEGDIYMSTSVSWSQSWKNWQLVEEAILKKVKEI